jgi:hypothetical protein
MARILLAIAVTITLLSISCNQTTSSKTTTYNTDLVATTPAQPTERLVVQNCLSWTEYGSYISFPFGKHYEGTFFHIIGEIKNVSSKYIRLNDSGKIEATFYDVNGSVIDYDINLLTIYRFFDTETVSPGGKWPLKLILFDEEASAKVDSFELKAKGRTTTAPDEAEILSYSLNGRADTYILYAEVKNIIKFTVEIKLIAIFYDEEGTVVSVESAPAAVATCSGEKSPAFIAVHSENQGNITSYELITRCELSSSRYADFETFNVVYHEGSGESRGTITGEVRNVGEKSIDNTYIYVSFYDTEGKIIDYTAVRVNPRTLGPGEIGTFELNEPSSPWQMPNYSLIVRAS